MPWKIDVLLRLLNILHYDDDSILDICYVGLSLEETLSRMAYHLDHGKLDAVLGELNSLDSMAGSDPQQEHTNAYVKLVMNDWHEETKKRYMVDQISSVLRCEAALVHGSQV